MDSHRHNSQLAMDQSLHPKLLHNAAPASKDHPDLLDRLEMMERLEPMERMDRMQWMDAMDKC